MTDYRPYSVRQKEIEELVAAQLAAEYAENKRRYDETAGNVETYNTNLPSAIGPSGYRRPQGQRIEPYSDYRYRIALSNIALAQKRLDEARTEEERQLNLRGARSTIKKGEAETEEIETETAGAQQSQDIIQDLRQSGALGMEKGKLTTRGNYELTESGKLDKSIMGSQIKDAEKTIKKIDEGDLDLRNKIIMNYGFEEQFAGRSQDYIVNSIRNQLKIQTDELKKKYSQSYDESVNRIPATEQAATPSQIKATLQSGETIEVDPQTGKIIRTPAGRRSPTETPLVQGGLRAKVGGIGTLPEGLTEADIEANMEKYGKTREEVIAKYRQMKGFIRGAIIK